MKLSICIHRFFDYYLPRIKGVSPHTIKAYRDTFTIFLPYAAKKLSIKIDSLMVEHLCSGIILDFLDYPETHRRNIPRTRNLRPATFKSLAKMISLINCYITKYRPDPKPPYRHRLFINQRGEELTRHGIHRLCQKYLSKALPPKRLKGLNPAHSFRHSCAINMLLSGRTVTEIKNRLGHENIETTMVYPHLDLSYRRGVQKKFIEHTQSIISCDQKIEELIDWENKEETPARLDSL